MSRPAIKCSITSAGCVFTLRGMISVLPLFLSACRWREGFLRLEADLDKRLKTIEHALYSGGLTGKLDELI